MTLLHDLTALLGPAHVLTGADCDRFAHDWTGNYKGRPLAVIRPADTAEVAASLRLAAQHGVAVVPVSGNTGLVGGSYTEGGLLVSLERMNRIREIRRDARIAVVEAGVILSRLHDAADLALQTFVTSPMVPAEYEAQQYGQCAETELDHAISNLGLAMLAQSIVEVDANEGMQRVILELAPRDLRRLAIDARQRADLVFPLLDPAQVAQGQVEALPLRHHHRCHGRHGRSRSRGPPP